MTVVAIDFETANRSPASACAIGLAFIENGAVTRRFYSLLRPHDLAFDPINIRVHGIRPSDVITAPEFPDVWQGMREELAGALVLAHNASFDVRVLGATLAHYRLPQPAFHSFCTVSLARRLWPDEPSRKLSALAAKFGIGFRHHHAGEDAFACAAIALEGVRHTNASNLRDLADTLGLARPVAPLHARKAGGIADRALAVRTGRKAQADGVVSLRVNGSKGTPYDIALRLDGRGGRQLFCSCPGARFRSQCRHTQALEAGDYRAVIVSGDDERERLSRLLSAALRLDRVA